MNRSQPFRQHHVTRALKGALAAGMSNPRVEVRLTSDGATISIGADAKGNKAKAASAASKPAKVPRRSAPPARGR
jgi:hypothetical protein